MSCEVFARALLCCARRASGRDVMQQLQKLFFQRESLPTHSPPSTFVSEPRENVAEAPASQHRGSVSFQKRMQRNLEIMQQRKKPVLQPHKVQRMIKAYVREERHRPDVRCTKAAIKAFCGWLETEMEQRPLVAQALAVAEGKRTLMLRHVKLAELLNADGKLRLTKEDFRKIKQL